MYSLRQYGVHEGCPDRHSRQLYRCTRCRRRMSVRSGSAFCGYRFPDELIAIAVRWYLRYRLSYADVSEWLAERGVQVDPSTIYDWVRAFTPRFIQAARVQRTPVGRHWLVEETYLKIGGRWRYLFRAIDEQGQIVDVYLSERRNATAARAFFEEAIHCSEVVPTEVTTDKAKCYPGLLRTLLPLVQHRPSKYLNNSVERDHQHLKGRLRSMRCLKSFVSASTFCRGHVLVRNLACGHSLLGRKGAPRLRLSTAWNVLAATL